MVRSIAIGGFMGVGKTTVARGVAEALGLPFCDLDDCVERMAGESIAQIFERSGEATFRGLESTALQNALSGSRVVLALGGGTLHAGQNCAFIQSRADLFCLSLPLAEIEQRIGKTDPGRPLWDQSRNMLYESRKPLFVSAGVFLDVSKMSVDQVVERIVEAVA